MNRFLKLISIPAIVAITTVALSEGTASAGGDLPSDEKKVFVCKYVGTPGVDERLQTGDNPINVSVNSIPDPEGDGVRIGDEFADKHGRSIVIAFDEGQPEPDPSMCPPPAPNEATPPALTQVDACGTEQDGVIIPDFSEAYSYFKLVDGWQGDLLNPGFNAWTGKTIASPSPGIIFPGGTQTIWEFEFSDEPCKPTEWPTPTVEVICGAEDVVHVPEDTDEVKFHVNGGPGHTNVIAVWIYDGSVLQKWEFTDNGEECSTATTIPPTTTVPATTVPPTVPVTKSLETTAQCQSFTVTNTGNVITLTQGNDAGYSFAGSNLPPSVVRVAPGETVVIPMEVGQTILFNADGYTITGPVIHTAVNCNPTTTTPATTAAPTTTVTPVTSTLPPTGTGPSKIAGLGLLLLLVGGALAFVATARRRSFPMVG